MIITQNRRLFEWEEKIIVTRQLRIKTGCPERLVFNSQVKKKKKKKP